MKSIRRELLIALLAAVLVAGCIAALIVYDRVRQETGELLDYQLRQMALAVRNEAVQGSGTFEPPPYGLDYAIQISSGDGVQLYYSRSRVRLPSITANGYARVDTPEGPWRVYTQRERGVAVQVAQPMGVREQLAARAAWRTILPFVLLLPLLAVVVWLAVTRGLRPLSTVAAAVKARSPASLEPLPDAQAPDELKPLVHALNDLLPRLSRALEMQRAFVADAAHELRTPLTALRLQLQLAERAKDDTERTDAFAALRHGLERATHVVEQLLTLAREEPSNVRRDTADVDLTALASEVVGAHAPFAEAKGIDLGLARHETDVNARGEAEALRTLLSNLVDNALRYTPPGGRVDVCVYRGKEGAVAEIVDTGPGIPAEERTRVFDRFYRRSGSDTPGSGLGLAIVKSIADRHGALVTLEDGPGARGLRVGVVFPLRQA
jgi:two-component system, OmpR family, sensor kinase